MKPSFDQQRSRFEETCVLGVGEVAASAEVNQPLQNLELVVADVALLLAGGKRGCLPGASLEARAGAGDHLLERGLVVECGSGGEGKRKLLRQRHQCRGNALTADDQQVDQAGQQGGFLRVIVGDHGQGFLIAADADDVGRDAGSLQQGFDFGRRNVTMADDVGPAGFEYAHACRLGSALAGRRVGEGGQSGGDGLSETVEALAASRHAVGGERDRPPSGRIEIASELLGELGQGRRAVGGLAQQLTGDERLLIASADRLLSVFGERVDPARTFQAIGAANRHPAKTALRLHGFGAVPGQLDLLAASFYDGLIDSGVADFLRSSSWLNYPPRTE